MVQKYFGCVVPVPTIPRRRTTMVLMQLLSKEDVVGLSPRELEVLDSLIDSEIMQSAEIKKILKDKVTDAVTALKKAR
jgi:hypothetical protein